MQVLSEAEFKQTIQAGGRLLAIDHGKKRIGLALSDVEQSLASPLETLTHAKFAMNAQAIAAVVEAENIVGIIIGYPLNMDGSEGPRCQSVRAFVRSLEAYVSVPMLFWDERLSSAIAQEQMAQAALKAAQRADKVDKLAATAILQSYLES